MTFISRNLTSFDNPQGQFYILRNDQQQYS
ncbi:MbtH family NRPS accessory protein, partial [Klebsiella pneumoniae]|nr:MbtH family NRPS accessory protein [Klebsiella pneumoniae]